MAGRRARLLRFLVEQSLAEQEDSLKESVIAMEVFDRPPDYHPKIDSVVRAEMGRLRSRLIEYYAGAGLHDVVRGEEPIPAAWSRRVLLAIAGTAPGSNIQYGESKAGDHGRGVRVASERLYYGQLT